MKSLFIAMLASAALFWSFTARAEPIDLAGENLDPIGQSIYFLKEGHSTLMLEAAIKAYTAGEFTASTDSFLNFGIGSKPVWLRFDVNNLQESPTVRRLSLETSWIDKIDVYFMIDGKLINSHHTGDSLPFFERPINNHLFVFEHDFEPGRTTVYIRAETPDPMVLPIYLNSIEVAHSRELFESNSYGFLYGGIFTLLAYNLMLFFSLKSRRYLYYSVYLGSFLLVNSAYTGHGYAWLWPGSPHWQLWSNPVLMMVFSIIGLLFATSFLNTKAYFPRVYRATLYGCLLFGTLQVLAVVTGNHLAALLLSFSFVFLFSAGMLLLGAISLYAGNKSAKYFLLASITHVSGSSITAMAVWGIIPYSTLAYRAVEAGMMIDAILLAMALADQFRITQEEKIQAERLARVDPLTELNNRRAFYELSKPLWSSGQRNGHDMSVIIMDIDRFKRINDNYGHTFGDNVLIDVANVLMDGARSSDIIARWGGEEFIIFLTETSLDDAIIIAERFRHKISTIKLNVASDSEILSLKASFGIAHTRTSSSTIDELILTADKHLYMAKEYGRDQVCSGESKRH